MGYRYQSTVADSYCTAIRRANMPMNMARIAQSMWMFSTWDSPFRWDTLNIDSKKITRLHKRTEHHRRQRFVDVSDKFWCFCYRKKKLDFSWNLSFWYFVLSEYQSEQRYNSGYEVITQSSNRACDRQSAINYPGIHLYQNPMMFDEMWQTLTIFVNLQSWIFLGE